MSGKFDNAFDLLMEIEGGFVDHKNDPGKATKYGISSRSHPDVDIVNLTEDGAKAIYKRVLAVEHGERKTGVWRLRCSSSWSICVLEQP